MRLLAFALLMFLAATPARAQSATDADGARFRDIITAQIEAFRADDGPAAYTHAAPKIRQMFPTPDDFMALVKRGYPQIYRPEKFTFGPVTTEMRGQPTQRVTIVDAKGKVWTALYGFEKQPDGAWKINGVQMLDVGAEA
ncbi:MAG: DUF4864 domain-containing protein [Aestuariivirgaceae bacterium]|nr:DUF4864 domain-containing protein [Aestuariivirgaceae bacterium]